jgi:cellulose synthase/poly-beta-1,6-N-acetylglucosamine synthase-like glycosyltransferase
MTEIALWVLVVVVAYAYTGYPLLLVLAAGVRSREVRFAPIEPPVTVVIAAFNEERDIARKLEMVLALDYPAAIRQVIVASDCSTDRTHEIVQGFAARGVELVALPERGGKTAAQNLAVSRARGEIVVFTDATTDLAPDVLRRLVEPFADPRVGCAGAHLEYRSAARTAIGRGGRLYWRYERFIKRLESRANSLIGVSGCLYAVRRALYVPIAPDLISDLVIALDVFESGHVTVYVPGAHVIEDTHERPDREFAMRCRVVVRSIHALAQRARLLDPFHAGVFALQLWSHKVLRYLVPELLIVIFALSAWLAWAPGPRAVFYQAFTALQFAVYAVVPTVYVICRRFNIRTGALSAPFYFVLANAAALWGLVSYLRGVRAVTWTTVR